MEQIYTIPVNEAFEASAQRTAAEAAAAESGGAAPASDVCFCPFCEIMRRLEENELDLILGASMMEPDVRIKTNELGFCPHHYDMMLSRGNRLSMALVLESHLDEYLRKFRGNKLSNAISPGGDVIKTIDATNATCYVCGRIEYNFSRMVETAALLWGTDPAFKEKAAAQKYYCLPHYKRFVEAAKNKMQKKVFAEFMATVGAAEDAYFEKLGKDVSWFCKKFDYRYNEEPWYDSKDAVERAVKFLTGETR